MTKIQLTDELMTVKDNIIDVDRYIFGDKQFIPLQVEYYNVNTRSLDYHEEMVNKFNIIKYWHE
jgi:hypothetical protein